MVALAGLACRPFCVPVPISEQVNADILLIRTSLRILFPGAQRRRFTAFLCAPLPKNALYICQLAA